MKHPLFLLLLGAILAFQSCDKEEEPTPAFSATFKEGQFVKYTCEAKDTLRSSVGASTHIHFLNLSNRKLKLMWVNQSGALVAYPSVNKNSGFTQQTFLTHPWLIQDEADGSCLTIVTALRAGVTDTVTFRN